MSERLTRLFAVIGALCLIGLGISFWAKQRANRDALAAEARAVAPQVEANRALRREDEAREARRAVEAAAERAALENSPEVAIRRAYAAEVSLRGGVVARLTGTHLDELTITDRRCGAALYLVRMINEGALDTRSLVARRFRIARCHGSLIECSEIDPTEGDLPSPRPCRF